MRILMVNKYFFIKGGAERYFFELSNLLINQGHEVLPFAMKHERNELSEYSRFFVDAIDYTSEGSIHNILRSFSTFLRMVWFKQAQKRIEALILETKPDIAHLHMIDHQISPSILPILKKYNIPVIQTVHQYKLICPNYRLYNMRTHQICEKCIGSHAFHPVIERCHMDSVLAGAMIGAESQIHRCMNVYKKYVDIFHVPSHFMGEKLKEGGIPEEKIHHLFYTLDFNKYIPSYRNKSYFLYYGRLAREKGVMCLLKAIREIHNKNIEYYIVGEGPEKTTLESYVHENELHQVRFLGYKSGDALKDIIDNCMGVIIPSEWYDNSPLVIYESMTMGKPVIVSRLGGMPELIQLDKNGFIFDSHDYKMLSQYLDTLICHPQMRKQMGKNARQLAKEMFHPNVHYKEILKIYNTLL